MQRRPLKGTMSNVEQMMRQNFYNNLLCLHKALLLGMSPKYLLLLTDRNMDCWIDTVKIDTALLTKKLPRSVFLYKYLFCRYLQIYVHQKIRKKRRKNPQDITWYLQSRGELNLTVTLYTGHVHPPCLSMNKLPEGKTVG